MKTSLLLLSLVAAGAARAEIPTKPPLASYARLWTDSAFTKSPVEAGIADKAESGMDEKEEAAPAVAVAEVLSDWSLCGLSEYPEGAQVTLTNKKDPSRIEVLRPGQQGIFTVVKVVRGKGGLDGIQVTLSDGKATAVLGFEKSLLAPAKPLPKATPAVIPRATRVQD